jgi:hypothetical protein
MSASYAHLTIESRDLPIRAVGLTYPHTNRCLAVASRLIDVR